MYLKLTKTNLDSPKFMVTRKQNDYQYLKKDDLSIFIYGYPFNYSTESWVSPKDVHQLYSSNGLSFINDIEGVYTIIISDKIKKKCFAIVDRYGIYTLFYSRNHDYIILSDVISEIIALMPNIRLNEKSLIVYLNFGFKLGKKTHIEDIYEFESSRVYEINQKLEMTERIYWEARSKSKEGRMTKEDFRAAFNAHIAAATSLSKKICLPLTGGIDTRMLLSACIPKKERLHCYTHGIKDIPDVKLAQAMCNHFGIRHSFYELSEKWIKTIPSMAKKNAEIYNGQAASLHQMHVEESYSKESGKGELLITGNMGNEIWRCILGQSVVDAKNIDDVSLAMAKEVTGLNPKATGVYYGYSNEEVINLLKESVKAELPTIKSVKDPVALAETFVFRSYCSNWASNSLKALGKHFKVFAGLLNRDLLGQIYLMDLAEKINGSIQKHIIIKNSSYLASLPLDTGASITTNWITKFQDRIRFWLVLSKIVINVVSRRIIKSDIFRGYPFLTDYPDWLRSYHKEFVLEVLNYERMATRELFKRQELEKAVTLFLNGDNSLARFVASLISLEIWLKRVSKGKDVTIRGQRG